MEQSIEAERLDVQEQASDGVAVAQTHWVRSLGVGAFFLLAALVVARTTSAWIAVEFADRTAPRDLLFERLPYIPSLQYATDIVQILALALLVLYAFRGNQREIPKMMALFGIMELTRAFMNVLTPLGGPLGNGAFYGLTHIVQNGQFPSGHTAAVFLCMLLVDRARAPRIWLALAVCTVLECVTLLLSHGHYSIDVVGGLMLSYVIVRMYNDGTWFNWLKPLVTV